MASLSQKIKITLDETRMLVLGTQVLMMLQFELPFESAFHRYPDLSRLLVPLGLCLLILTLVILLSGPAFHRVGCEGRESNRCHAFMTRAICLALWPLAVAMGLDGYIVFDNFVGRVAGIGAGCATVLAAVILWELLARAARSSRPREALVMEQKTNEGEANPAIHEQVSQVLTEARVVLPGAQAMLGFQFVTMFMETFWTLPASSRVVHLASVAMTGITVILLIAPAAFHRIAERGEDTHRLVRVAAGLVIAALVPLALAISGDLFVVVRKVTESAEIGAAAALTSFALAMALWFGYPLVRRKSRDVSRPSPALVHLG